LINKKKTIIIERSLKDHEKTGRYEIFLLYKEVRITCVMRNEEKCSIRETENTPDNLKL